ncbi:MAG: aminodeoxychorismate/anthranilate synthase component II [Planctomycetes bacterium]|nr:aminodeoxychorismate/anthranilate synthase component II [Planctomycetota bacterium]
MILVIDNYDSFTYNLVQRLGELGATLEVYRNDKITVEEIEGRKPNHIIVSPGPCTPLEAGISNDVVKHFAGKVPVLGVCLGHQCISHAFGGKVVRAKRLMHGKTSMIEHDGRTIFRDIENPFEATRYHSLIVPEDSLPDDFEVTARVADSPDELMGMRHKEFPLEGVQFHPESFLTDEGPKLLKNFLQMKV